MFLVKAKIKILVRHAFKVAEEVWFQAGLKGRWLYVLFLFKIYTTLIVLPNIFYPAANFFTVK